MRLLSNKDRPVHLGHYPLERLRRASHAPDRGGARPPRPAPASGAAVAQLSRATAGHDRLLAELRDGPVAPKRAPLPDDPRALTQELKAACYFLDAAHVAACRVPVSAWYATDGDGQPLEPLHRDALVIVVARGRLPEPDNLARGWTEGSEDDVASARAGEIAVVLAGYVRKLGFAARAHMRDATDVVLAELAIAGGLAERRAGAVENPFLGRDFSIAAVTTDLRLEPDAPLAEDRNRLLDRLHQWVGTGGAVSELARRWALLRPTHLSRFPMERLRRVEEPTTLILEDEVPRVPLRASFWSRATRGDLGEKTQKLWREAPGKHPLAAAMIGPIAAMIPLQDGPVAPQKAPGLEDPEQNARALKSLCYYLGADLVGICEMKPYMWYSHDDAGQPIEARHKYGVVVLVDQGHETMEGASGDDWISAAQSIHSYLRSGSIVGRAAAHLRRLGYASMAHSVFKDQVVHIPMLLAAGLGELSRIGELVLNPFVGPRFKTAVLTTDLPLSVDKPIDFGLQDMCSKCHKCARECPCDAIPYGDKVMFNGYEMWKPDVERCTRYRITNQRGSMCGRCMKTCPYNQEGLLADRLLLWAARELPFARRWIAELDDWLGHGNRNPVKRWWRDLQVVGGPGPEAYCVAPEEANARDLDLIPPSELLRRKRTHRVACYTAEMMPGPAVAEPVPLDRKQALAAASRLETPAQARARAPRRLTVLR